MTDTINILPPVDYLTNKVEELENNLKAIIKNNKDLTNLIKMIPKTAVKCGFIKMENKNLKEQIKKQEQMLNAYRDMCSQNMPDISKEEVMEHMGKNMDKFF